MYIPEIALYHYKARAYSPSLGRFMHTDPIGYGDGLNMYAYVGNDPVSRVDPLGLRGYCVLPSGPQDSRSECEEAGGKWVVENSGNILAWGTRSIGPSGIGASFGGLAGGGGCGGNCNAIAEVVGDTIVVTGTRPEDEEGTGDGYNPIDTLPEFACLASESLIAGGTITIGIGGGIFLAGLGLTPIIPDGEIIGGIVVAVGGVAVGVGMVGKIVYCPAPQFGG